jgi:hypothetical protein
VVEHDTVAPAKITHDLISADNAGAQSADSARLSELEPQARGFEALSATHILFGLLAKLTPSA